MKSWQRKQTFTGRKIRSVMEEHEVRILHSLVANAVDLFEQRRDSAPRDELAELTGIRSGHQNAPDSAALARLLPDFRRPALPRGDDDPLETAEVESEEDLRAENSAMRMIHEPEILDAKLDNANTVLGTLPDRGGAVALSPEQAEAWLRCLNDLRLGLGATITGGEDPGGEPIPEKLPPSDPRAPQLEVYHWLTFVQDSLCTALMGE